MQNSEEYSHKGWLARPNMSHWPQQLNFLVWRATTDCGISPVVFDKVPEQI